MATSFTETVSGSTMNLDLSKAIGGARDIPSLCTDLFLIVIRMREAEDLGDPASLRKLILYYIELFKKNCKVLGTEDATISDALYAIVALIDETVLTVPGACRDYWFARPLQIELFGDNIAGEEFFKKLLKLSAQPEKQKDVLEIYYICMSLGFEGKFKIFNPEERVTMLDETGRKLRRTRIRASIGISPHGTRKDDNYRPPGRKKVFPLWLWASIIGAVSLIAYCGFYVVMSMKLSGVMEIVEQLNAR